MRNRTASGKDDEQALEAAQHLGRHQLLPRLAAHHQEHENGEGEAIEEGGGDEQRRHDRRIIGLARDQEAEDRAGAGGQRETPDEREPADGLAERRRFRRAPVHHGEQVGRHDQDEAAVEIDVPGEDRLEIVVRHRDEDADRPAEIEHQHHQAASQQRYGEDAGQPRIGLVGEAVEHGRDRGDVERPRGGHDQEHREHVRRSPDDLVAHAGDDVAVLLHIERGADPERQ